MSTPPRLFWRLARFEIGTPLPADADTTAEVLPVLAAPARPDRYAAQRIHGLLIALTVLLVLVVLTLAQGLIVPIVLAAFLAIALSPWVGAFGRILPRGLASALVTAGMLGGLYLLVSLLAGPAQAWAQRLPESLRQLSGKLQSALQTTLPSGPSWMSLDFAAPTSTRLSLWDALAATPPILTKLFSVVLLTFVFLLHGERMLRRLVELSPRLSQKKRVVAIVRAIQSDTTRYLFITTLINLALGVATAGMLSLYGFPDPLLFGAVAMVANFIPYVGAFSVALLLALVGLGSAPTLGAALLPAASFGLLTALEGQFLSPAILGQRLSLSPVAILLWLMVWGWLWGLPGVLLGVPMLMCLKIIAERLDGLRWLARAIE